MRTFSFLAPILATFVSVAAASDLADLQDRFQQIRALHTNCDLDSNYTLYRDGFGQVGITIKGFTSTERAYYSQTIASDDYSRLGKSKSLFGSKETYSFWIPKATGGLPLGNKAHQILTFTLDRAGKAIRLDIRERMWLAALSSPILTCKPE